MLCPQFLPVLILRFLLERNFLWFFMHMRLLPPFWKPCVRYAQNGYITRRRTRRCRAGRRKIRKITVVPCSTHRRQHRTQSGSNYKNLIAIQPIENTAISLHSTEPLRIALFNARSVCLDERRTEIKEFVQDQSIDILFLTETWLKPNADEARCEDLTPTGYSIKSFARETRGGGIAVLAKNSVSHVIKYTDTFSFSHTSFELIQATLSLKNRSVNFFCLYRPPPSRKNKLTTTLFHEQFPNLLEFGNSIGGGLIILGDFNFHFDQPTSPAVSKIIDSTCMFNLVQTVSTPTHKSGHILDWVLHRPDDDILQTTNISHELTSDHFCIVCNLALTVPKPPTMFVLKRNITSIDRSRLIQDINQLIKSSEKPTAEQLDLKLRLLLDKHAPPSQHKISCKKCTPWYKTISDTLHAAKMKRHKAERRWRSTGLTVDKEAYDTAKRAVTNIVHTAKSKYYSTKIAESTNAKHLFSITNKLMSRNKSTPLPKLPLPDDLPELFSNFFCQKVQKIRDQLDSNTTSGLDSPYTCDTEFCGSTFNNFKPISEDSLRQIMLKCAPKTCELDSFPSSLLLECIDAILPTLTEIINSSLLTGVFPSIFKTAIVKPLLKKASLDSEDLKNYRPVSNLSFMSKVLEKVALSQILAHLNSNKLLSNHQSAYRPSHSTETALLKVVNDLLLSLDDGKISVLVLLDLSAAFDTIDHEILLHRLHHVFGFRDPALSWFRSYLEDRSQTVSINGKRSSSTPLHYGVPQGSVLGPVLFILYMQPLSNLINSHPVSHQMYADDTQVYKSCLPSEIAATIDSIESCISDVKAWTISNKLQMNEDKTEAILIARKGIAATHALPLSVRINDASITFTQALRDLGVTLDNSLTFHQQVINTCRTAYLELRRISSVRKFLSIDATKTLVCSLVLSRLDYCNSLLSGVSQYLIKKLQKVQNTAARITLKVPRTEHSTPLLCKLHWLPICSRINYKVNSLCYTTLTASSPKYLSDLLSVYTPARPLRSSLDSSILKIPSVKTKSFGQRSFTYQGPSTWNQLPLELRQKENLSTFKRVLKTHLFKILET